MPPEERSVWPATNSRHMLLGDSNGDRNQNPEIFPLKFVPNLAQISHKSSALAFSSFLLLPSPVQLLCPFVAIHNKPCNKNCRVMADDAAKIAKAGAKNKRDYLRLKGFESKEVQGRFNKAVVVYQQKPPLQTCGRCAQPLDWAPINGRLTYAGAAFGSAHADCEPVDQPAPAPQAPPDPDQLVPFPVAAQEVDELYN